MHIAHVPRACRTYSDCRRARLYLFGRPRIQLQQPGHLASSVPCVSDVLLQAENANLNNCISIFAIDKSGSMSITDRYPLPGTPVTNQIARVSNNRLGAVCSALHAFWSARQATAQLGSGTVRRDAYSLLLFDTGVSHGVVNDVSSSSDQLLRIMLRYQASGGTSFNRALDSARTLMEQNWSTDRFVVSSIRGTLTLT